MGVIRIVLLGSIALTMFALGLATRRGYAGYLFRHPGLLVRSLLSMNIVVPLLAVALVAAFDLNPALEVALVALALSPVSPLAPGTELKAGGRDAYAVSLQLVTALLAVPLVPLGVHLVGRLFGYTPEVPAAVIAQAVLVTVLLPLIAGIVVRTVWPGFAQRLARPAGLGATIGLLLGIVPLLVVAGSAILALIGNGTLVAIAALVIVSLAAGHLLAGREPEDRSVLAVATASRHPAVAIATASAAAPGQRLVGAAVILYLLLGGVASAVYVWWVKRHRRTTST